MKLVMQTIGVFIATLVLGFLIGCAAACAADVAAYEIPLKEGLAEFTAFIFASIGAAVGAISTWLFKGRVAPEYKAALDLAIIGALQMAEKQVQQKISEIENPDTHIEILSEALKMILTTAPALVRKAGVHTTTYTYTKCTVPNKTLRRNYIITKRAGDFNESCLKIARNESHFLEFVRMPIERACRRWLLTAILNVISCNPKRRATTFSLTSCSRPPNFQKIEVAADRFLLYLNYRMFYICSYTRPRRCGQEKYEFIPIY